VTDSHPTPKMITQAAAWAAQLATDEATQSDREACDAWCDEHPLHRLAMDRMRGFDARIDQTDAIGRETIETVLEKRSSASRSVGGVMLGVLVLGCAWLAAQSIAIRSLFPDYATVRGEQRALALADGSGLDLDTDTALDFSRAGTKRIVTLFRGRILARVAKDAAHPFVVETRDGTATALGTAFTVLRNGEGTTVTVLRSRVRACAADTRSGDCVDLLPGDQALMTVRHIVRLGRIDPDVAAMWSEGWLGADDQPVATVLIELNRYRRIPVRFDAGDLADIRVSGSFPLSDPERALQGILQSAGLAASQAGDGTVEVRRAK
jgi:transmembrane sensor